MIKIGVISDTHIPECTSKLPDKLVKGLAGMDMIVHAGDLADVSVLEALKGVCTDVRAVAGNMDNGDVCRALPEKLVFKTGNFSIGVTHGYGPPQKLPAMVRRLFKKDKVDLIIFGHSHQPVCSTETTPWLFNPGSPTDTIFAPYRSFGVLEIGDRIQMKIIKL
jgi:uncharacterized protein